MNFDTQIIVIGAGVIGLAVAASLSKKYSEVFVIEKHHAFGQETSSRNSEVIHSGIYYPTGSLKAFHCIHGRRMLYSYCDEKLIPYKQCGKLIVATSEDEVRMLSGIAKQATTNGVEELHMMNKELVQELEPNVLAEAAIHFPLTGIIDTHSLMKSLETDAAINGTQFVYKSEVIHIKRLTEGYEVTVRDENQDFIFTTRAIINAAGLFSDQIAKIAGIYDNSYQLYYWKGEYFAIGNGKNKLVNKLIYPIPNKNITGLGIHSTIDLSGGLKLGPNSTYLQNKQFDYSVDKKQKQKFFESARRFLPFLELDDLHPDQAGIRPKLQKPGDNVRDFIIRDEKKRGYKNFINLIGIESPGLTSCLSIANSVNSMITLD